MPDLEAIKAIVLQEDAHESDFLAAERPDTDRSKARIFVVKGTLLALGPDMTAQEVSDVQNSQLFAQLAADAVTGRLVDPAGWMDAYRGVLAQIGWAVSQNSHQSSDSPPPIDWPTITKRYFPAPHHCDIGTAIARANKLSASSLPRQIWARAVTSATSINYCVAAAEKSAGSPSMSELHVYAGTNFNQTNFVDWQADWALNYVATRQELNDAFYGKIRSTIEEKLGSKIEKYIVPIA